MKRYTLSVFRRKDKGQGLVEYALILALIAIIVVSILSLLGVQVGQAFARIVVQMKYPGTYSGDPVTVTGVGVVVDENCYGPNNCTTTVRANVGLDGASGSPNVCVQFSGGGGVVCGSPPESTYNGSGDGVTACVVAVEGYSLTGGSLCGSP